MPKVRISEDDLEKMLSGNPDLVLESQEPVGIGSEPDNETRPLAYAPRPIQIISFDDYRIAPYTLPEVTRPKAWRSVVAIYPARAWVALIVFVVIFWDQMLSALVLWFVVVNFTPFLKWSE